MFSTQELSPHASSSEILEFIFSCYHTSFYGYIATASPPKQKTEIKSTNDMTISRNLTIHKL